MERTSVGKGYIKQGLSLSVIFIEKEECKENDI